MPSVLLLLLPCMPRCNPRYSVLTKLASQHPLNLTLWWTFGRTFRTRLIRSLVTTPQVEQHSAMCSLLLGRMLVSWTSFRMLKVRSSTDNQQPMETNGRIQLGGEVISPYHFHKLLRHIMPCLLSRITLGQLVEWARSLM